MLKKIKALTAVAAFAATAAPAVAQTEIQGWQTMTGPNNGVIVNLATDFTVSQTDYKAGWSQAWQCAEYAQSQ